MKKQRKNNRHLLYPLMAALLTFGLISCNDDDSPAMEQKNVVEVATENNFTVLVSAIDAANLRTTLTSPGPFTVFAPTNDGFSRFMSDNNLTTPDLIGSDQLESVLSYHVLAAEVPASQVSAGRVNTVADIPFFVSVAPNDEIWINGSAKVIQTDVNASNGIIHVLDYVIAPPQFTIAQIAVAVSEGPSPQFTQLTAALIRANLVGAFRGGFEDDLTVFAPTDAAFQELYTTLGVNGIDGIPVETLTNVLLYHVVPARAFSQDLRQGASLPTLLEGENLTVDLANLQINDASLIPAAINIHAKNGVIHAIDKVLMPE